MMLKDKKASKIDETDEVALMVAAKNYFQNNKSTEVKKARAVFCTWFLAKAILAQGTIDGCEVKLAGYVERGGKGKMEVGRIVDDLEDDLDEGILDTDFNAAKETIDQALKARESSLAQKEDELAKREAKLKELEDKAMENPLGAVRDIIKEDQKEATGEVKTDSGANPPITNPESSMSPNPGPKGKGVRA